MREIYHGKDIRNAFPRSEGYMVMCSELIQPEKMYSIKETTIAARAWRY